MGQREKGEARPRKDKPRIVVWVQMEHGRPLFGKDGQLLAFRTRWWARRHTVSGFNTQVESLTIPSPKPARKRK